MTMTAERLAELDAVMAKATAGEWGADGLRDNRIVWSGPENRVCFMAIYPKAHADSLAIVALHNAYPDLKAHIAALEAALKCALNFIENTEGEIGETLMCGDMARAALNAKDAA